MMIILVVIFIVGNHTVYRMSALTGEDKNEWIKKIRY